MDRLGTRARGLIFDIGVSDSDERVLSVTGFVIMIALALLMSGLFVVFFFTDIVHFVIDKVSVY